MIQKYTVHSVGIALNVQNVNMDSVAHKVNADAGDLQNVSVVQNKVAEAPSHTI